MVMAMAMVRSLSRVSLGADGATVTIDAAGDPHAIRFDLTGAQSSEGKGSGLAALALIGAAVAGVLRIAAYVVRLFV